MSNVASRNVAVVFLKKKCCNASARIKMKEEPVWLQAFMTAKLEAHLVVLLETKMNRQVTNYKQVKSNVTTTWLE